MCSKMLLEAAMSCNDVHLELEDDDYVVTPTPQLQGRDDEEAEDDQRRVMKMRKMIC